MPFNQRPFTDAPLTLTDDRAYLLEARSTALLRVAPVILITLGLGVGVLSLWVDPEGDRLVRLAEMVIAGALGSLTTAFGKSGTTQSTDDNLNFFEDKR